MEAQYIDEFIKECKAKAKSMGFDSIDEALIYLRKKQGDINE